MKIAFGKVFSLLHFNMFCAKATVGEEREKGKSTNSHKHAGETKLQMPNLLADKRQLRWCFIKAKACLPLLEKLIGNLRACVLVPYVIFYV